MFKFPTKCNETELFLTVDQRESLMEMRESVENEVAQKFLSNDTKVIIALKEVITEEFKKTDEKLDHIRRVLLFGHSCKCFTYVTKTCANLTTYSRKLENYNGTIIFEIDIMKNSSPINLNLGHT